MQLSDPRGVPYFTDTQVRWLEDHFPARCKLVDESIEAHMSYAGRVALIAWLRSRVIDGPVTPDTNPLGLSDEELTALQDEEATHVARTEGGTRAPE
jgi:hypothetical protein